MLMRPRYRHRSVTIVSTLTSMYLATRVNATRRISLKYIVAIAHKIAAHRSVPLHADRSKDENVFARV
jgi:hypothetical protein